jgi:hypothetical protein
VPNVDVANEFVRDYLRCGTQFADRHFQALEARKAKVATKKAPVKAKAPGSSPSASSGTSINLNTTPSSR